MIYLHDKRNFMSIFACYRPQNTKGRGDRIAAALDRELDDVLRIEVRRVRGERRPRRVLDALVDRQNREVAGAGEAAAIEQRLQAGQHARRPIGSAVDALDVVGPGQMQLLLRNRLALVPQQRRRVGAEDLFQSRRAARHRAAYARHVATSGKRGFRF